MELIVDVPSGKYPIVIEKNCLADLNRYIDLNRPTMLVYDSGIPKKWINLVKSQFSNVHTFCFPQGEGSKTLATLEQLFKAMSKADLNRKSQVVALGGGVTGDMAGFAAACYMRGIDFYNLPTTVLSQVDSSVGGKTAVDLGAIKNIIGAFWQPKAVFIDPNVLETLDSRQIAAGLAEALKMAVCFDRNLFEEFEKKDLKELDMETILSKSVDAKRRVVEADEKENGLRKVLNFGHTIGHAIEGSFDQYEYLHGECVGAGMLYFLTPDLKSRLIAIEKRLGLPQIRHFDTEKAKELLRHDKKATTQGVSCVVVDDIEDFHFENRSLDELFDLLDQNIYE